MTTKADIVDIARTYKGVPYRHQGRSAVTGVDCAGLLTLVADEIGVKYPKSLRYTRNPETFNLQEALDSILTPISIIDIEPGDVLLFKIDVLPQHVGIVGDYLPNKKYRQRALALAQQKGQGKGKAEKMPVYHQSEKLSMIHCYNRVGEVVEHRLAKVWLARLVQAYEIPGMK